MFFFIMVLLSVSQFKNLLTSLWRHLMSKFKVNSVSGQVIIKFEKEHRLSILTDSKLLNSGIHWSFLVKFSHTYSCCLTWEYLHFWHLMLSGWGRSGINFSSSSRMMGCTASFSSSRCWMPKGTLVCTTTEGPQVFEAAKNTHRFYQTHMWLLMKSFIKNIQRSHIVCCSERKIEKISNEGRNKVQITTKTAENAINIFYNLYKKK